MTDYRRMVCLHVCPCLIAVEPSDEFTLNRMKVGFLLPLEGSVVFNGHWGSFSRAKASYLTTHVHLAPSLTQEVLISP